MSLRALRTRWVWPLGMNSTQVIGVSGFARWAEATKEISQSLSRNQQERKVLRHSASAEGGEGFGLRGSAVEGMGVGRGVAITLCPVVVVREKEGCFEVCYPLYWI